VVRYIDAVLAMARRHWLVLLSAALAVAFVMAGRVPAGSALRAVDVDLLLVLFALLTTIEILRASGYLELAVASTLSLFPRTRPFGLALIILSGALASLVTNDVALFVLVPFTIIAGRFSEFDVEDAVILEIIAANLVGCLTPLGNPQNLFVFHRSAWSAGHFIGVMAPFAAWNLAGLLAVMFLFRRSRPMAAAGIELPQRSPAAGIAGAVCFAAVVLEIARVTLAWEAAVCALIAGTLFLRRRILSIDYSIVPLFFFTFIIVEGLRSMHVYRAGANLYAASIALSQVVSNVPATVLLSPMAAGRWRELLYGVDAAGCGTIIASLANLLGWRIYVRESGRDPHFFRRLMLLNFVFLAWAAAGGWLLLR